MTAPSEPKHNPSYVGVRVDLLRLVAVAPGRVLDVGCATGKTGARLKQLYSSHVEGIELDPSMAEHARSRLDSVYVADLNQVDLEAVLPAADYDLILFGDVLEHLVDPWAALATARARLATGGTIVVSLPNIRHYTTLLNLAVLGRWPYRDRGIHDRTHLRFFTRSALAELYGSAGLGVLAERRTLRLVEQGSPINRFAKFLDFPPFRSYLTFQYLHRLGPIA